MGRARARLWQYQIPVEAAQNLLGILSELNHLYYSTFQFKRMSRFIKQMSIAPLNLSPRLESLFHTPAPAAFNQLEELVRETVELVDLHMPQVDTSLKRGLAPFQNQCDKSWESGSKRGSRYAIGSMMKYLGHLGTLYPACWADAVSAKHFSGLVLL